MNADLRKMRKVEERREQWKDSPWIPAEWAALFPANVKFQPTILDEILRRLDRVERVANSVSRYFEPLGSDARPYLIDSDGVPPREGEFEK